MTPKRVYKQDVCPECRSVVHWYSEEVDNGTGYETVDAYGECCNEDCDFSVKGLRNHDGWEDHQQEARWKRKNREARLRNKIRKLSRALKEVTREDDFWRNYYKHFRKQGLLRRSILIKESGTCGQDVEGS